MAKVSLTDQDYELWWFMLQASRAMHKARNRELSQYNLTRAQAAILVVVQAIGYRATPADITRFLLREPHSVSGLLKRMEKDGLVRKVKDLERKNMVRVELTEKGLQAYHQSTKRDSIHRIVSCLSKEDRQKLSACLMRLRDKSLEELGIVHKPSFPFSRGKTEGGKNE